MSSGDNGQSALTTAGTQLSRHASIYMVGSGLALFVGLLNAIALTHFLDPSGYGQLGLLFVFSGFLTVFYNLFTLPGTFSVVFGGAGAGAGADEDDVGDEDDYVDDDEKPKALSVGAKRRAMGTGLLMTVAIASVGTIAVVALRGPIAGLLQSDGSAAVLWAGASGAFGAVWRLMSHTARMERRPVVYVVMFSARPLLVIAIVISLVASGYGVTGAVAGTALGTALASVIVLVVLRSSYRLTVAREFLGPISRRGFLRAPTIISYYAIQNGDILILSHFAGTADVGVYRLATRFGSFVSYFTSSLFMSWGPLRRSLAFKAADREQGNPAVKQAFATYFMLGCAWLLLALGIGADALVRVAPSSYADAAPLIPLVGGGFIAHGIFILVLRLSTFPHKTGIYIGLLAVLAIGFVGLSLLVIPVLGAAGAALSVIAVFLIGAVVIGVLGQTGGRPVPYEYGRIAAGLALAGACFAGAHVLGAGGGVGSVLIGLAALLAFPLLVVLTRIIPPRHWRPLLRILRWTLPTRTMAPELREALGRLDAADAAALGLIVGRGWSVPELAQALELSETALSARVVRALRQLGETGTASNLADQGIAAYLFSENSVADREMMAARLIKEEGVSALEMYAIERTLQELRRGRRRIWSDNGTLLPAALDSRLR